MMFCPKGRGITEHGYVIEDWRNANPSSLRKCITCGKTKDKNQFSSYLKRLKSGYTREFFCLECTFCFKKYRRERTKMRGQLKQTYHIKNVPNELVELKMKQKLLLREAKKLKEA